MTNDHTADTANQASLMILEDLSDHLKKQGKKGNDADLARALNVSRAAISQTRNRGTSLGVTAAARAAYLMELPPMLVLSAVLWEQCRFPEERAFWKERYEYEQREFKFSVQMAQHWAKVMEKKENQQQTVARAPENGEQHQKKEGS